MRFGGLGEDGVVGVGLVMGVGGVEGEPAHSR